MPVRMDFSDRTHCVHGKFIGGPCGPDYMCGECEMGYGPYIMPELHEGEQWTPDWGETRVDAHVYQTWLFVIDFGSKQAPLNPYCDIIYPCSLGDYLAAALAWDDNGLLSPQ